MEKGDKVRLKDGRKGRVLKIDERGILVKTVDGDKVRIKKGMKSEARHGLNLDRIKQDIQNLGQGQFWKPAEGKNVIRILPPWSKEGMFYLKNTLHYGFSIEGQNRALPCLIGAGEKKCPGCDLQQVLLASSDAEDKKLGKRVARKTKFYSNIIDRKGAAQISIYGYGGGILRRINGYITDPDWGDITDPEEGYDVIVERTGTGFNTRYEIRLRPKPSPIGLEDWAKKLNNLDEVVREPLSFKEFKAIVEANFGDMLEDLDTPKKKKRVEEDEEIEEIDED